MEQQSKLSREATMMIAEACYRPRFPGGDVTDNSVP